MKKHFASRKHVISISDLCSTFSEADHTFPYTNSALPRFNQNDNCKKRNVDTNNELSQYD